MFSGRPTKAQGAADETGGLRVESFTLFCALEDVSAEVIQAFCRVGIFRLVLPALTAGDGAWERDVAVTVISLDIWWWLQSSNVYLIAMMLARDDMAGRMCLLEMDNSKGDGADGV